MIKNHKYCDKNHKPIPIFNIGDVAYTIAPKSLDFGLSGIEEQKVRKIEVRWNEDHWEIAYKIKGNNSEWQEWDDNWDCGFRLYDTPENAKSELIEETKRNLTNILKGLHYTNEKYDLFDDTSSIMKKLEIYN